MSSLVEPERPFSPEQRTTEVEGAFSALQEQTTTLVTAVRRMTDLPLHVEDILSLSDSALSEFPTDPYRDAFDNYLAIVEEVAAPREELDVVFAAIKGFTGYRRDQLNAALFATLKHRWLVDVFRAWTGNIITGFHTFPGKRPLAGGPLHTNAEALRYSLEMHLVQYQLEPPDQYGTNVRTPLRQAANTVVTASLAKDLDLARAFRTERYPAVYGNYKKRWSPFSSSR